MHRGGIWAHFRWSPGVCGLPWVTAGCASVSCCWEWHRCPAKTGSGSYGGNCTGWGAETATAQMALCIQLPKGDRFPPGVLCSGPNSDLAPVCSAADGAILPTARLWEPNCSAGPRVASAQPAQVRGLSPAHDGAGNGVPGCGGSGAVHLPCCHIIPLLNPPAQAVAVVHRPPDFPQHMNSAMFIRWDTGFFLRSS